MKILFTGASSFSGYWFTRELVKEGHEVVALFRRSPDSYTAVRKQRVDALGEICRPVFGCAFGDEKCLSVIQEEDGWNLLCHHAAETRDYKSGDFDITAAVESNTRNLGEVLDSLCSKGCRRVLLTGSVFENGEGAGGDGLPAFSPYGLSKAFTAELIRYHGGIRRMSVGKFVIPNPFGPYEDGRFTSYLVRSWYEGEMPTVRTPEYVRDNIHVSLLSKSYARFAEQLADDPGFEKINPSGYVESQEAFSRRFSEEMRSRLQIPCPLEFTKQTDFSEPRVRINTDTVDAETLGWDEERSWSDLADYYRRSFGGDA